MAKFYVVDPPSRPDMRHCFTTLREAKAYSADRLVVNCIPHDIETITIAPKSINGGWAEIVRRLLGNDGGYALHTTTQAVKVQS